MAMSQDVAIFFCGFWVGQFFHFVGCFYASLLYYLLVMANVFNHNPNFIMVKIKELDLEKQQREGFERQLKATRAFRATGKKQDFRQEVDKENGCIYGVSVCTEGEALGHGCWLDSQFIDDVTKLGNKNKAGLKARFGHPAMSGESFGTFVGRFHNFRTEGIQVFADLYFDESAKHTPNGDLQNYILSLAASDPEAFGTSIVFTSKGYFYKKTNGENISTSDHSDNQDKGTVNYELELDENGYSKYYIEMGELWGCDMVDEPAANPNGLFSSKSFNKDKFAVIATEFLDTNPKIAKFLTANPHKLSEFLSRYNALETGTGVDATAENEADTTEEKEVKEEHTEGGDAPENEDEKPELSAYKKTVAAEFAAMKADIKSLLSRINELEDKPADTPLKILPKGDAKLGKPEEESSWVKAAKAKIGKNK
jgi:hypothetical protein